MKHETISSKTSAIDLVVGDLMCVRKVSLSLSDSINERILSENTYEERALNVMEEQYAFSGQSYIGIAINEEYVTREAIISCSLGTRYTRLDLCEDHGIIAANQKPLMTCEDCKIFRNISSFDRCNGNPPTIGNLCIPMITKAWIQQEGHLYIFDAAENKYVDVLRSSAYLTCRYGGLITVKEVFNKVGPDDKIEMPWIPSAILQLDGETEQEKNLTKRFNSLNKKLIDNNKDSNLIWNQQKIDILWEECKNFYEDYGIQVDPRLLLAIIAKESTGSFNTSGVNLAADGGHGVLSNFALDCCNAIDIVGGKIMAYPVYHDDFSAAREEAYIKNRSGIRDYDDILHYINWNTPRISTQSKELKNGVYAEDNNWNRGVRQIFSEFAFDGAAAKYTEYALNLGKDIFMNFAAQENININKIVTFEEQKNGEDTEGNPNGEYTIIGIVPT